LLCGFGLTEKNFKIMKQMYEISLNGPNSPVQNSPIMLDKRQKMN